MQKLEGNMSNNLSNKIIELESKFTILINKFNELKKQNKELKEKLTYLEIEVVIKDFKLLNNISDLTPSQDSSEIKKEIDNTIETIDSLIESLKS
tara:strand:- start:475 stop:759 length:285 start_codon:yes stop_codon:yes gene_type:complete